MKLVFLAITIADCTEMAYRDTRKLYIFFVSSIAYIQVLLPKHTFGVAVAGAFVLAVHA